MRFLRLSFFPAMKQPPLTTVVAANDLKVPVEEAAELQIKDSIANGGFAIDEIFEDEGEIEEVTMRAVERMDKVNESHMATLFFWTLAHMDMMREGGAILPNPAAPNYPAPMSGDQAERTLELMALSPECKPSVKVEVHCADGTKLQLLEGKVTRI